MKAVITVIGMDRTGIIYGVSSVLAENDVNIMDISQTILQEYFTMVMLVDLTKMKVNLEELKKQLQKKAEELKVTVRIQHEDIFKCMHEV